MTPLLDFLQPQDRLAFSGAIALPIGLRAGTLAVTLEREEIETLFVGRQQKVKPALGVRGGREAVVVGPRQNLYPWCSTPSTEGGITAGSVAGITAADGTSVWVIMADTTAGFVITD